MSEREYDLFTREIDGLNHMMLVSYFSPEERAQLPWAATVFMPYEANENGLPVGDEYMRISKCEEMLMDALAPTVAHCGHSIGARGIRMFFYGPQAEPKSVTMKLSLFKKQTFDLHWRHDPDWSLYASELEPDREEALFAEFQPLWAQLERSGDDATKPRPVDFGAAFPTAAARLAFLTEVATQGFVCDMNDLDPEGEGSYFCEIVKTMDITPASIIPAAIYLTEQAELNGGEFDGWASPVVE